MRRHVVRREELVSPIPGGGVVTAGAHLLVGLDDGAGGHQHRLVDPVARFLW